MINISSHDVGAIQVGELIALEMRKLRAEVTLLEAQVLKVEQEAHPLYEVRTGQVLPSEQDERPR